jgi:hypothetical protein
LISECQGTFDAVRQLLTVPARSNSSSIKQRQSGGIERRQSGGIERRQSGAIERKQSVESTGTAVTDNGLSADGPGLETNDAAATTTPPIEDDVSTHPPASK